MIDDITTCDENGHWDVWEIKLLCEYRDRLKAALDDIRQTSLTWAMVCPCDCTMCAKLHEAIRDAEPTTTSTQSEKT